MGYYTGPGVVEGGGESYNVLRSFAILGGGSFKVSQRVVFKTTVFSGVSLSRAQAEHESHYLTPRFGGSGSLAWIVFDADGTRSTPTYRRINGSNLCELAVNEEELTSFYEQVL